MRIWDISKTLDAHTPKYPDDPDITVSGIFSEAGWRITRLGINSHSGSHFDFPRHFFDQGACATDFGLDYFLGPCTVAVVGKDEIVDVEFIKRANPAGGRLLLRTDRLHFNVLTVAAAEYIAQNHFKIIGTDSLGIEEAETEFPVHNTLLGGNVLILENLELANIAQGRYIFVGLPIKLGEGDGAPARVFLVHPDDFSKLLV